MADADAATATGEEPDAVAGTGLSAQATVQPDNNEADSAVEDEAEPEGQEYGHDEDTIQDLLDYGDGEELLDYGEPGGSEVEEEDEQPVTQEGREETGQQKGSEEEQQASMGKTIPAAYFESNLEQQGTRTAQATGPGQGRSNPDRADRRPLHPQQQQQQQHSDPRDSQHSQRNPSQAPPGRDSLGRTQQQPQQRLQSGRNGMPGPPGTSHGHNTGQRMHQQQGLEQFRLQHQQQQQQLQLQRMGRGLPPQGVSFNMPGFSSAAGQARHSTVPPPNPPAGTPFTNGHGGSIPSPPTPVLSGARPMLSLQQQLLSLQQQQQLLSQQQQQQRAILQQQMPQPSHPQQNMAVFNRLLHGASNHPHLQQQPQLHIPSQQVVLSQFPNPAAPPSAPHPSQLIMQQQQQQQELRSTLPLPNSMNMAPLGHPLHQLHAASNAPSGSGMPLPHLMGHLPMQGLLQSTHMGLSGGAATTIAAPVTMPSIFTLPAPVPVPSARPHSASFTPQQHQQHQQRSWTASTAAPGSALPNLFPQPPSVRREQPALPAAQPTHAPRYTQHHADSLYGDLDLAQLLASGGDTEAEEQDFVGMVPAGVTETQARALGGSDGYRGGAAAAAAGGRGMKRQWMSDGRPGAEVPAGAMPVGRSGATQISQACAHDVHLHRITSPRHAFKAVGLIRNVPPCSVSHLLSGAPILRLLATGVSLRTTDPWAYPAPASPTSAAAAAAAAAAPRSNKWVRPGGGDPSAAAALVASASAAAAAAAAAGTAGTAAAQPPRRATAAVAAAAPVAAVAGAATIATMLAKQEEYMANMQRMIEKQEAALKRKAVLDARKRGRVAAESPGAAGLAPTTAAASVQRPRRRHTCDALARPPLHPRAAALGAPAALPAATLLNGGAPPATVFSPHGDAAAAHVRVPADGEIAGLYESSSADPGFEFQGDDAELFEDVGMAGAAAAETAQLLGGTGTGSGLDPVLPLGGSGSRGGPGGRSPVTPVQHQAEQHQQQQHQQQQRQSQGRQAGHDDSRGREAGGARTEGGSGRSQANDSSRRRDHSRDRPSGDSRRRQDRSSERNTTREGVDTRDRDPHSGLDKPRSHRSERAPHGEEEHSSLPGMRGGFRDESSNQSSGRDSARRAEAEEARPAEFDLRQRLDAAKRAKRAQDGESSGGRHRCGRRRPPARQRDEMRAKPGQPGVADSGKHSRMARCVCRCAKAGQPSTSPSDTPLHFLLGRVTAQQQPPGTQGWWDCRRPGGATPPSFEEEQQQIGPPPPRSSRWGPCKTSAAATQEARFSQRSSNSSPGKEGKEVLIPLCRICLEEDDCAALCEPCGCSGTQRHAHHACIQRWVLEKGHLRCEALAMERLQLLIHDPATGHEALDLLDESDRYYRRNPGISWWLMFILFIVFLVIIHHTMVISDNMDMDNDGGEGEGGRVDPGSGGPAGSGPDGPAAGQDPSLSLFLFWVATKAFVIGLPLYTVMKIAARQARREQYEALMRATAAYADSDPTFDRRVLLHLGLRAVRPGREEGTGMVALGPAAV
ncbi:MAG: hypothetical protein WDW38_000320 [Sanguina aurantia]